MPPRADSATLNVQPRQRRDVYKSLAALPTGSSVKDLLRQFEIPESELRETLRKLDAAGLARRMGGTWQAVPLETAEPRSSRAPEAVEDSLPQD
jgi:DNA-binding IclR family transcriptional regulator